MKMPSLQLHTCAGVQYIELEQTGVLIVYLAVSMVMRMAEGTTWLSSWADMFVCFIPCSPSQTQPSDVQQSAIQNEMPHRLWILFIWELGAALFPGVSEQAFTSPTHSERAATVVACGSIVPWLKLPAVDVCSSQSPSLHAMNTTGSMTEKQLEEGEADTVQLL